MSKFLLSILVVFVTGSLIFWMSLSSTISPKDVQLKNDIKIIPGSGKSEENQVDKQKITILLKNKSSKPLIDKTKGYFYTVYVYKPSSYKFLSIDYSNHINPKEFSIGSDSRTENQVIKKLKNINIKQLNKISSSETPGFMYIGKEYPISIDYYFAKNNKIEEHDNFYVIFSFYQKKFGKNLSWSKLYSVENPK